MKKAQATIEYIFLIALVAAAVIAMLFYISRGLQGNIRDKADQLGAGQYDPVKTRVKNLETKHVTYNSMATNITTIKYGETAGGAEKKQLVDDGLADVRKSEQDLAKLEKKWQQALEAEALTEAKKGLLNNIWEKIKEIIPGSGGDKDTKLSKREQLDLSAKQIATNRAQRDALIAEKAALVKEAKGNPAYDEQIKLYDQRIAANESEFIELRDTRDLVILDAKTSELNTTESDRLKELVPGIYATAQEAIDSIKGLQEERAKTKDAANPTTWISAADNTSAQEQASASLEATYDAIKENTPPPETDVEKAIAAGEKFESALYYEKAVADKKLELANNVKAYAEFLSDFKDWEANAVKQNQTSSEDVNIESGKTTINRVISETSDNF